MAYAVQWGPAAERGFRKLPRNIQVRIKPDIDSLAENPHPRHAIKLAGDRSYYRIAVGDYRVVYDVNDELQLVRIMIVGHRRDIYNRLRRL